MKCVPVMAALALSLCLSQSFADEAHGADRHIARGMSCESCHGKGDPAKLDPPDIQKCVQCHPTKALVEKTQGVKPQNPHVSPHYQDRLECTNCHHLHEASENFCGQCHDFKYKVP